VLPTRCRVLDPFERVAHRRMQRNAGFGQSHRTGEAADQPQVKVVFQQPDPWRFGGQAVVIFWRGLIFPSDPLLRPTGS
jgi:hypothetical protein